MPEVTGSPFPNTEWTMVLQAGSDASGAQTALERLCTRYWPPLYQYARCRGMAREDSEDAVQGFLAMIIRRESLAACRPECGRFRSWLLSAFANFMTSEFRRDTAAKRGGGRSPVALDALDDIEARLPAARGLSPDEAFDRSWAQLLLINAVDRLGQEQQQAGKGEALQILKPVVTGQTSTPYAEVAARLAMQESNVALIIHRLRVRLRDIVRAEIAQTVLTSADLESELAYLLNLVRRE